MLNKKELLEKVQTYIDSNINEEFHNKKLEKVKKLTLDAIIKSGLKHERHIGTSDNQIAMRRIIKAPVWTVADQQAGRLPEVGCRVNFCHKLNTNWRTGEIKYIDDQVAVIKADAIDRPFVYEVDRVEFKPIESPEEKAQREENEFVKSEMKNTTLSMEWSCVYERGLRAAYRKLKMPEVKK